MAGERRILVAASEDVRMTTYELVADGIDRVTHRELASFFAHLREEDGFEHEVAELFAELRRRATLARLEHLVRLLEHERAQRRGRLLAVPRTAVRRP